MAKEKATITLDRAKAAEARSLTGATSTSQVVDLALDRLIRAERLHNDIEAYRTVPPTGAELEVGRLAATGALADDTDWEALYPATGG